MGKQQSNPQWTTYRILDATINNADLGDPLNIGVDGTGKGMYWYADTANYRVKWDETGDSNKGTFEFGANTYGVDAKFFGATSGAYMLWDASADDLLLVGTATQLGIAGTTTSSSTETGSIHTAGGLGVVGTSFFGDDMTLSGTAQLYLGTSSVPHAMTTTSSNRMEINFTTTVVTDYSVGLYALHTTADDAPAGGVMGVVYGRTNVKHTIQDACGMRGRMQFAPDTPAAESANMLVGVMAQASLDNAGYATTVADSIKGLDASVGQTATSTLTTGSIRAIYADISGIKVNNAGRTQGIFVKQGGGSDSYPDYGILCHLESNNLLAAIMLRTATSCVAPVGVQFTASTGSITALMAFTGTATYLVDLDGASGAAGTITTDSGSAATTWKARIKVKTDDGTDGWINVYSTSNE